MSATLHTDSAAGAPAWPTWGAAWRDGADRLRAGPAGSSLDPDLDARLEAGLLLAHVLAVPPLRLRAWPERRLEPRQQMAYVGLLSRRLAGEPVAYLLGWKEFWSLRLAVGPAVLVPRPETETLVQAALDRCPPDAALKLADLGTGSGAIALALAQERPRLHIVATDRAAAALALARANADALGLTGIAWRAGDWYAALGADERMDLIVSNPPYVCAQDPALAGALRHEPLAALCAGADGLDALRRLIAGAPRHLRRGGWLLLEHGSEQAAPVFALLAAHGFTDLACLADLAGRPRVSLGRWPGPAVD